jgi:ABC-2 type transport system ATP-binding protein
MSEAAVRVDRLTKRFGKFTAVDNLSFTVPSGTVFGLLGANGAGKSTTIRMLTGLLPSSSGSGRVAGFDINSESEKIKMRVGYMSQRFSLYEDLTVLENIRFYGGVYGLGGRLLAERTDRVLAIAGLAGRENDLTSNLAGGYKQRLALGCAVIHEPQIIFLDEPTGGVDPVSRRRFWDLITSLARGGAAVLVTTHYLDEAEFCNSIVLMHGGRKVAEGSPTALKREALRDGLEAGTSGDLPTLEDVFIHIVEKRRMEE